MKLLVLYQINSNTPIRETVLDHLYSFERNLPPGSCHYCNILYGVPWYLPFVKYDAVLLHYTLLSFRWASNEWPDFARDLARVRHISGMKIAFPQDEYAHSEALAELFRDIGLDTVYSLAAPEVAEKLYPREKTGIRHYEFTLAGYVNDALAVDAKKHSDRTIDVGYRARNVPFWLGEHGQIKPEVGKKFMEAPGSSSLSTDISTRQEDTLYGDAWKEFLYNSRCTLGCMGGASLHDPDGTIRKEVEEYVAEHPEVTFEEMKNTLLKEKDFSISYPTLGPRHLESAATRTCQVLVEDDYRGVLEPDVHYIPIKKDYSNLEEVIEKVRDHSLCEEMANRAFDHVVASGDYSYKRFVEEVVAHVLSEQRKPARSLAFYLVKPLLAFRKTLEPTYRHYFWRWHLSIRKKIKRFRKEFDIWHLRRSFRLLFPAKKETC